MNIQDRFFVFAFIVGIIHAETTLKSKISMAGIQGTVTLTQTAQDTDTRISYDLGSVASFTWEIHEFRLFYPVPDKCTESNIGKKLDMLSGTQAVNSISSDHLADIRTLSGRSISLTTNGQVVCATLEEDDEYDTVLAKFISTIGGTIMFRQPRNKPSSVTSIISDLFFINGATEESSLHWKVYSEPVSADIDQDKPVSDRCDDLGSIHNDLSSRNGGISVALKKGGNKNFFSDFSLPLSGGSSIVNKSLVIFATNGNILACANILKTKERIAKAVLSRSSVTGSVTFRQQSILDPTKIKVELQNLDASAGGYQVYEWPVPQKFHVGEDVCSPSRISNTWNPFSVAAVDAPSGSTTDQFQMGDLSGKYGSLDNKDTIREEYVDWNLPLFGPSSIVGRSLGINYKNNSRWLCGNINLDVAMVTAVATFHYPVIGHVLFRQPMDDWYHDTQVYVELDYGDGTQTTTNNHIWGFHENGISQDFDADGSERCKSSGVIYSPYEVSVGGDYTTDCSSSNHLRCRVGDLAGRHGSLSVRSSDGGLWKHFFTDINIPLSGPHSVVDRSLVIRKPNSMEMLACANVVKLQIRKALVNTWSDNQPSDISGTTDFISEDSGFLGDTSRVNLKLFNLQGQASGFHVHNYPLIKETKPGSPCGAAFVGGHFNPFGIDVKKSPSGGTGSDDKYEIGDLSGKYGSPLDDSDEVDVNEFDTELPLRGPFSIVGKSIVIHKNDAKASRWVCGDILEDTAAMKSHRYTAFAQFSGDIEGAIYMSQYMYEDSREMSDTEILMDLRYKDGRENTAKNPWRIFERPMAADDMFDCEDLGKVYNPFHVSENTGYDECGLSNPLRCMVGDVSQKQEYYRLGSGRRFYSDVNLPIYGPFSVVGRTFVILSADDELIPLGCASIYPYNSPKLYMYISSQVDINKTEMKQTVANALNTDLWNLAVQVKGDAISGCKIATVNFIGPNAESLNQKMVNMMKTDTSSLGKYAPAGEVCSAAGTPIWSVFGLGLSLLCLMYTFVWNRN